MRFAVRRFSRPGVLRGLCGLKAAERLVQRVVCVLDLPRTGIFCVSAPDFRQDGLRLDARWGLGLRRRRSAGSRSCCSKLRRRSITERGTEVCSNSHSRQSLPFPRRPWADLPPGLSSFLLTKGGVICQQLPFCVTLETKSYSVSQE